MNDALKDAALRLDKVARIYAEGTGQLEVFSDVSLSVRQGEVVALVGQSGAGKSSLLHMAGLLEAPSSGEIIIGGVAVAKLPDTRSHASPPRHYRFCLSGASSVAGIQRARERASSRN